jgi:hypothetical protein
VFRSPTSANSETGQGEQAGSDLSAIDLTDLARARLPTQALGRAASLYTPCGHEAAAVVGTSTTRVPGAIPNSPAARPSGPAAAGQRQTGSAAATVRIRNISQARWRQRGVAQHDHSGDQECDAVDLQRQPSFAAERGAGWMTRDGPAGVSWLLLQGVRAVGDG